MSLTTKVKVAIIFILNEKSYNKTVIDFNFGRHKDLSTLKSDIHFFGWINPYVYLIEVNNCITLFVIVVSLLSQASYNSKFSIIRNEISSPLDFEFTRFDCIYIIYYQSSNHFQFSPNMAGFPDIFN